MLESMPTTSLYRRLRSRAGDLRFAARILLTPGQQRYAWRFLRSRTKDYLLQSASPWITFGAIDFLERFMKPGHRVFEYGSGGSTLFWLRWTDQVTSVEHDQGWHEMMRKRLEQSGSIDYRLVIPVEEPDRTHSDPANPEHYASDDPPWRGKSFREYASQIDGFPGGHFDVVLVDGRARPSCMLHAISKIRHGGLLVLDNAERSYYLSRIADQLAGFERHRFAGPGPVNKWYWTTDVYLLK